MPAQFLTDSALNDALERIFREAEEQLILISPYIKLHARLQSLLKERLNDDKLFIQVVFGKNKENPAKSMSRTELEFFMQFPNIEIKYEERLHAKYYTNDKEGLITSMNLYDHSQNNNIESGILTSNSTLGALANTLTQNEGLDRRALDYFERVVAQADLIYCREPEYSKVLLGLSRKYSGSRTTVDKVNEHLSGPKSLEPPPGVRRTSSITKVATARMGYCIRTGVEIPFNMSFPLCDAAFESWKKFQNQNYQERYCHFTGEPSHGMTSFAKPVMLKNWNTAKATFNL